MGPNDKITMSTRLDKFKILRPDTHIGSVRTCLILPIYSESNRCDEITIFPVEVPIGDLKEGGLLTKQMALWAA